ncbi:hypothetical protein ATKI12_0164 [Kitasatospora sp. Ki12]
MSEKEARRGAAPASITLAKRGPAPERFSAHTLFLPVSSFATVAARTTAGLREPHRRGPAVAVSAASAPCVFTGRCREPRRAGFLLVSASLPSPRAPEYHGTPAVRPERTGRCPGMPHPSSPQAPAREPSSGGGRPRRSGRGGVPAGARAGPS